MLPCMDEMGQKGISAAAAYLERAGFRNIEPCDPALVAAGFELTAVDGDERVAVTVTVSLEPGEFGEPKGVPLPEDFDRADAIDLLAIAPDRAVLRHRRGVPAL